MEPKNQPFESSSQEVEEESSSDDDDEVEEAALKVVDNTTSEEEKDDDDGDDGSDEDNNDDGRRKQSKISESTSAVLKQPPLALSEKPASAKRPLEKAGQLVSSRAKRYKKSGEDSKMKKKRFQRRCSEDDGIAALRDVIEKILTEVGVNEASARQGWDMIVAKNKKSLEVKWKSIKACELNLALQRTGFALEAVKMMLEALNSS